MSSHALMITPNPNDVQELGARVAMAAVNGYLHYI